MSDLQPYQERVLEERDQLQDRLTKLEAFLAKSSLVVGDERARLVRQSKIMGEYRDVLNERINAWKVGV